MPPEASEVRASNRKLRSGWYSRYSAAQLAAAQLWQWIHHATGVLDEGRIVTADLVRKLVDEEVSDAACDAAAERGRELTEIVFDESFTMPAA